MENLTTYHTSTSKPSTFTPPAQPSTFNPTLVSNFTSVPPSTYGTVIWNYTATQRVSNFTGAQTISAATTVIPPIDWPWGVPLAGLLALITVAAIMGNIVVIVAIFRVRALRRNHYIIWILNLAFADLLLAMFVMPPTAYFHMTRQWVFGPIACSVYMVLGPFFTCSSTWSVTMIAIDRYRSVIRPQRVGTDGMACRRVVCTVIWLCSLLFGVVSLWCDGHDAILFKCGKLCHMYIRVGTIVTFMMPISGVIVLGTLTMYEVVVRMRVRVRDETRQNEAAGYGSIRPPRRMSYSTEQRLREPGRQTNAPLISPTGRAAPWQVPGPSGVCRTTLNAPPVSLVPSENTWGPPDLPGLARRQSPREHRGGPRRWSFNDSGDERRSILSKQTSERSLPPQTDLIAEEPPYTFAAPRTNSAADLGASANATAEWQHRARMLTRMLWMSVVCFIVTWLPFSIVIIISSFTENFGPAGRDWNEVFLWLGYLNSAINPIIYAVAWGEFNQSIVNMLPFRRPQNRPREGSTIESVTSTLN